MLGVTSYWLATTIDTAWNPVGQLAVPKVVVALVVSLISLIGVLVGMLPLLLDIVGHC